MPLMIFTPAKFNKILVKLFSPLPPVCFDGEKWVKRFSLIDRLRIFYENIFYKKFSYYSWKNNLFIIIKHIFILLLFPIYLPLILLFKIFDIKILHINFLQFGAFVHHVDFLIKQNKLKKKPIKLILLCPKNLVANKFLAKLFNKEIFVSEGFMIYLILYPLMHYDLTSIEPWDSETTNYKNIYNKIHKSYNEKNSTYLLNIDDTHISTKNYQNFLIKNNLDHKKFVCFHLRDSGYYNFSSVRDVNVDTYLSVINFLLNEKIPVIRFINKNSKKIKTQNEKLYHEFLVDDDNSKAIQYHLIKNSKFVICTQSGIYNLNSLLKTPFFLTNAIPINICGVVKKQDLIIFKKFKLKYNNEILKFDQIIERNLHMFPEFIAPKNNIEIIENTEDEILDGVKELLSLNNQKTNDNFLKEIKKFNPFINTDACTPKNFKI